MAHKSERIFIGLEEIAGLGAYLVKGFREIGYDSKFYTVVPHPFDYGNEEAGFWVTSLQKYIQWSSKIHNNFLHRFFWYGKEILLSVFLIYALLRFDVFIFLYTHTFLYKQLDLPILKFFKKKIIMIECGADVRPNYLDLGLYSDGDLKKIIGSKNIIGSTLWKKEKIVWMEKWVDHFISIRPMSIFHHRPVICSWAVGIPKVIHTEPCVRNPDHGGVTILHAPSNPFAKGTPIIRHLIEELKNENYNINYIELQGQPNHVVMQTLKECDFVIDQLYSDTPMAGFAAEAAFYGKPALVGGEYAEYIYDEVPASLIPPSEYVPIRELKKSAVRLIEDKEYRECLGKRAKDFVEKNWNTRIVAEKFIRIIHDDVPTEWMLDTEDLQYLYGAGAPVEKHKDTIRKIIREYGISALCVDDKPNIKKAYMKLMDDSEQ